MGYFEPYIDADGVHVPTYSDIMEYLENQYKAIFGNDVYLGEETPDYQMLSIFATCVDDSYALAVQAYNDRNPQFAVGDALDTLVQLSGMIRKEATPSKTVLTITGDAGTVIDAGEAIDSQGNLWALDEAFTIPVGGSGTVGATCETAGAIEAEAGTIAGIYTPIPGWMGVTNAADAEVGTNMETDAQLRARFDAAHVLEANGTFYSIATGLMNLTGVKFVDVVQNDTDSTDANGLPAHSFCVVVDGGDADEIAEKIFDLKAPGVATHGSTTKTVVDSYGNNNTIKFSRPTQTDVVLTITLTDLGGYSSGEVDRINEIIKNALMEDVNSLGIGKPWMLTMGYKDIYAQFDSKDMPFAITSIASSQASSGVISCAFDHVLHLSASDITITT